MGSQILTYAFSLEKKLIHIDQVENGIKCECTCPSCNEQLIAKNYGKIKEHHFAHPSGCDCGKAWETIRHIWGKEIIFESKLMPILLNGKLDFISAQKISLECTLKELDIVPDVIGVTMLRYRNILSTSFKVPIITEIFVSHKVDVKKAEIIKKAGIPAIEIDLSKSIATTKEELISDICNTKNWRVINAKIGEQFTQHISALEHSLMTAFSHQLYGNSCQPRVARRPKTTYNISNRRHK